MNRVCLVSVAVLLMAGMANANAQTDADAQYKAGADFAREIKGKGDSSLNNFNPGDSIPNYTDSPGEKNYYGGVTATGDGAMKADGTQEWTTNDATQAVTDSFINNPKEPISPDAPFIQASQDVQSRADTIIGKTGQMQCEAQQINRSEFTNYSCERDIQVEQACTRTAEITGNWTEGWETRFVTISPGSFSFQPSGNNALFSFQAPVTGNVVWATLNVWVASNRYLWNMPTSFMNTSFNLQHTASIALSAAGMTLSEGQIVSGLAQGTLVNAGNLFNTQFVQEKSSTFTLEMLMNVKTKVFNPTITWTESCPFSKSEGTLKNTECIEPGSTKTVVVEGKPYQVTQACWKYKDTYMTQAADAGTCKKYIDNPACTLASRKCAFSAEDGGGCLHEYETWSCETRTAGKVMICGGDTFCLDGECERAQKGKNNDFAPVVSALAALAAAGKDVADLNGVDVRAFTGSAKFCKKFAVGFSDCCKDSGWGQDIGIANCSTEEKALGKAKEKQLTVSVGEFCSKKVLGVCLEKKRGYCQFDSKLAQIVQQQGRNGQLRIGFGAAKSPDCRGITQTELQQIKFDNLDFSNFFEDLQNNQNIPDNNALTERVREQIATQLQSK
ncbi:type-F conjugative transfer system mating-pair stabilization protein TraN [Serratia fonticola]|uniref:type-F conjugative transfer system mating-pair stabilization protein TraN n=1 Tax=Serratia fonticola TaxID=47917 RepID=UPI00217B9FD5|nr:type-F conjugative transfer system mating-pair stabilization protein TraN [Serratia fonticola]CAI1216155.1 conjugal transfer mating pair stabilization protein TraN [Serratia fonticola]CAI1222127.1 conjugal transfer mating pair stabilization protein TraN [Serratia fonticola]